MKIAIDTRQLQGENLREEQYFLYAILKRIIKNNPQHEFIFIFDRAYDKNLIFAENVTAVARGPKTTNLLTTKYWYDITVPATLKKYKADIFVAGNGICSLTTQTPQCLLINDLSFLQYPSFFKKSDLFFLKRYTKRFLQKANSIAALSRFAQQCILSLNVIAKKEIDIIYGSAPDVFHPLAEHEKEEVKHRYTNGKNYFIYSGLVHPRKNLVNLLKAFTVFKKRQKSDWKLVIAGDTAPGYRSFAHQLATYKHRADVISLNGKNEEIAKLIASSYAFVYPSFWEGSALAIMPAMVSHIPVITSLHSAMHEVAGDAALYSNPADYKDIADKMMMLYKDESLRDNLVEKTRLVADHYHWDKAADLFWQSILKAIK